MTGNLPVVISLPSRMASETRRSELTEALNSVNLQIRPDSNLCRSYIAGDLSNEWSVQKVVDESALMHWLYNCTRYPIYLAQARAYWELYFFSPVEFDAFFRCEIVPSVKLDTIRIYGGVPKVWPWLKKHKSHGRPDVLEPDLLT